MDNRLIFLYRQGGVITEAVTQKDRQSGAMEGSVQALRLARSEVHAP